MKMVQVFLVVELVLHILLVLYINIIMFMDKLVNMYINMVMVKYFIMDKVMEDINNFKVFYYYWEFTLYIIY